MITGTKTLLVMQVKCIDKPTRRKTKMKQKLKYLLSGVVVQSYQVNIASLLTQWQKFDQLESFILRKRLHLFYMHKNETN